eukprot:1217887-Alexandrium_andersonii.AAC.1
MCLCVIRLCVVAVVAVAVAVVAAAAAVAAALAVAVAGAVCVFVFVGAFVVDVVSPVASVARVIALNGVSLNGWLAPRVYLQVSLQGCCVVRALSSMFWPKQAGRHLLALLVQRHQRIRPTVLAEADHEPVVRDAVLASPQISAGAGPRRRVSSCEVAVGHLRDRPRHAVPPLGDRAFEGLPGV